MSEPYLAIVNPAAGGGRCGRIFDDALARLTRGGIRIEVAPTTAPGEGTRIARAAYAAGRRHFIAVGGDGTAHELINGLFPEATGGDTPVISLLPLGTGNSFLRDFADDGLEHAMTALLENRRSKCDVLRLTHRDGLLHFTNLLSIGFVADVAATTNRRFKRLGERGYLLGVLTQLVRRRLYHFALRLDGAAAQADGPCLFMSFNNSKFTGGSMLIAPQADVADGLIEVVRVGAMGRLAVVRYLRRLYDGSYLDLPHASRQAVRTVEFDLTERIAVMVDGEIRRLHCERLDVLELAVEVVA